MNDYERKQEEKRERLERAAAAKRAEADGLVSSASRLLPDNGQPLLVGHHSEKRHRRAIERADGMMRKAVAASEEARDLERRAAGVGKGGISSDDPDAVQKLRAELDELKVRRENMKAANAAWRKGGEAGFRALGWPDDLVTKTLRGMRFHHHDQPFPPFSLSNLSANVRRIEKRIAELEAGSPALETIEGEWGKIEARPDLNRVALTPARRLSTETFRHLKERGWRWSRNEGAFLRHLNANGIGAARAAVVVLEKEFAPKSLEQICAEVDAVIAGSDVPKEEP